MKDNGFNNTYNNDVPKASERAPFKISKKGILRNSKKHYYTYTKDNLGKELTDNNPYVKVNGELFDYYTALHTADGLATALGPQKNIREIKKKVWEDGKTPEIASKERTDFMKIAHGMILQGKHPRKNKKLDAKIKSGKVKPIADLKKLKKEILDYVESLGMIGGFTLVDRRYINNNNDHHFPYDTMLIMGMEMTEDVIYEIPYPTSQSGNIFDLHTYVKSGYAVNKVADFIRDKGYKSLATVSMGDRINFVPHAVNAGLGMYSTHGLLLTKKWGTRLRLCCVTIDADIELDHASEDQNFEEFCARCRMCYKTCPHDTIPKDEHEWFGQFKRRVHRKKCGYSMITNRYCGHCIKVCPISTFGYDKIVNQSLAEYNQYNLMTDVIDKDKIRGLK